MGPHSVLEASGRERLGCKVACKPSSVSACADGGHLSRPGVADGLKRPTRRRAGHPCPPIWPCSGWGLPGLRCCQRSGELLPRRFTLTRRGRRSALVCERYVSVALSVGSPRPAVSGHPIRVELGLSSPQGGEAKPQLPRAATARPPCPLSLQSSQSHVSGEVGRSQRVDPNPGPSAADCYLIVALNSSAWNRRSGSILAPSMPAHASAPTGYLNDGRRESRALSITRATLLGSEAIHSN